MALLTTYPTEAFVKRERRFNLDESKNWIMEERKVTVTQEVRVYSTLDEARKYLLSLDDDDEGGDVSSDGVARRISDCGWAEVVIVKKEVTEWEEL